MIKREFKLYTPTDEEKLRISETFMVSFFQSKDGEDWHDIMSSFSGSTYKVVYESKTGHVYCVVNDITTFCPHDGMTFSVAELDEIPENFVLNKSFIFNDSTEKLEQVISDDEIAKANVTKVIAKLRKNATDMMEPLQYATELKTVTKEETELLKKWKKYVVELSRIAKQSGYPHSVNYPEKPE